MFRRRVGGRATIAVTAQMCRHPPSVNGCHKLDGRLAAVHWSPKGKGSKNLWGRFWSDRFPFPTVGNACCPIPLPHCFRSCPGFWFPPVRRNGRVRPFPVRACRTLGPTGATECSDPTIHRQGLYASQVRSHVGCCANGEKQGTGSPIRVRKKSGKVRKFENGLNPRKSRNSGTNPGTNQFEEKKQQDGT